MMTIQGRGVILQINDIKRFFDKENIRDVLDSLYNANVDKNAYHNYMSGLDLSSATCPLVRVKPPLGYWPGGTYNHCTTVCSDSLVCYVILHQPIKKEKKDGEKEHQQ